MSPRRHTFPARIATPKELRASRDYRCQTHADKRAPGHVDVVPKGETYVRVATLPPKDYPGRWSSIRLCVPCARSYGLVE